MQREYMLGHKSIQNTLLYTQLISFENDEYHSATAKTVEDAQKLIEADPLFLIAECK